MGSNWFSYKFVFLFSFRCNNKSYNIASVIAPRKDHGSSPLGELSSNVFSPK